MNSIFLFFFASLLLTFSHPNPSFANLLPDLPTRLDGKDRFEVANKISGNWNQASTVVLVNYLAFADALTVTPLAYKLDAPILLTHSDQLTDATKNQLLAIKAENVIIVGGEGSVSHTVVNEINSLGISKVTRISGKDRFAVSEKIAAQLGVKETAIFANGLVFSDALTIAPYAAIHSFPILLTKNNEVPPATEEVLQLNLIKNSIVIGGEASMSKNVFSQLPGATRIDGKDRYEVAANVVNTYGQSRKKIYLATGMTFADALTGSVLAAKENAVILLTNTSSVPDSVQNLIKQKDVPVTILGGTGSVKDSVVQTVINIKPTNRPIVYIVPHQDDEILSYGIDIRNELTKGRNVQLILLTRGGDSGARDIINGKYDSESATPYLAGVAVYCQLHHTYHNPINEHYKDGSLSRIEFANARTNEYYRASIALGVPGPKVHTDFIPDGSYSGTAVKDVIMRYLAAFPNADVRTFSSYDGHSAHALLGRVVKGMQDDGTLQRYQAKYFVSIYTDRFFTGPKPTDLIMNRIEKSGNLTYLKNAVYEYERFEPLMGYYAVGYHSVTDQFNALMNDPYVRSHY